MGVITFYEGNGASQNIVQSVDDRPGQNFRPVKNDEIRSAKLQDVRAGCVIRVYDDPNGGTGDDYAIVTVKQTHPGYIVGSFQENVDDAYVKVQWIKDNGLDGKISRIKID
ncbi:hypothetical protein HHL16_11935 [Pseudoflavitalea sp. G-6-1-2]|uniref:hypothetical protein n=1 Tax=Pseudoflavitalea sp. G-6-1-2 TaxID=2728841 RepID=UPI001469B730|nr:hypothetical protein [Pseudoflavitalea sp. G-6-1-2]NML21590.1 hypothetical protein [Pseudoflavitalea sp. G-6-1-2]